MMIKITDKCSMGCIHCISDCKPSGKHMRMDTFIDAMNFQIKYGGITCTISGGEPTENPEFIDMLKLCCSMMKDHYGNRTSAVTVTTNGLWLSDNAPFVKMMRNKYPNCVFQVVVDGRYYPVHVDESNKVFTYSNVMLCRNVERIYPQGRALKNNLNWEAKASKCFNIRAMAKQMKSRGLDMILAAMNMYGFFCTPHIDIKGNLVLGESSLCPEASNIYKTEDEIIEDFVNFKCHSCDFINEKLPNHLRTFVNL